VKPKNFFIFAPGENGLCQLKTHVRAFLSTGFPHLKNIGFSGFSLEGCAKISTVFPQQPVEN
jgi:hypothetical protein